MDVLADEPAADPEAARPDVAPPRASSPPSLVIHVCGISKRFKIYANPWDRLSEWLTLGRATRHQEFWALRDVTFDLRRGESLGIIGINGSGKSTLLKILSGAMHPTAGSFDVRGRVLSLLELGTGLNPELTGRQNVLNSSRLLAFPPGYAEQKLDQIEAFAELGGFFDKPARLYSSGMFVRLAFSMFACFEPDVFIIDEALSVGDVFFQQKCAKRIQAMRDGGTTLLFVSHDLAAVEALCDRVLLLHQGRVRHEGDKKTGISLYYALGGGIITGADASPAEIPARDAPLSDEPEPEELAESAAAPRDPVAGDSPMAPLKIEGLPWQPPQTKDSFGDGRVQLTGICYRRADGHPEPVVAQGSWLEVFLQARAMCDVGHVNLYFAIHDRLNRLVFARGWVNANLEPVDLRAGDEVVARFSVKLDLEPGEYIASFSAAEALPDPASPTGWNQHVGGARYCELPRASVIAVIPRSDRSRASFGPANLQSVLDFLVNRPSEATTIANEPQLPAALESANILPSP